MLLALPWIPPDLKLLKYAAKTQRAQRRIAKAENPLANPQALEIF
jgi:hypothetical protein